MKKRIRIHSLLLALLLLFPSCPVTVRAEEEIPSAGAEETLSGNSLETPVWDESQELVVYSLEAAESRITGPYDWDEVISRSVNWMRGTESYVLTDDFLGGVSSTATDWTIFDLGRLGVEGEPYEQFLSRAGAYVAERYSDPEKYPYKMSNNKLTVTEWHRLTVAIQAAGGDPANIGGQNLIKDGTYDCVLGDPWQQGTNGAIWALIALDTRGYEVPSDAKYSRKTLIDYLLNAQLDDGGWALSGDSGADTDITGMALQALAPYIAGDGRVREAVDKGIDYLRSRLTLSEDGSLGGCEATVQAIVAWTALGMDPSEEKSVRSGASLIDGLMAYYNASTGAFQLIDGSTGEKNDNRMTTDQALYAVAAYRRYQKEETNLYDFREDSDTTQYLVQNAEAKESRYAIGAGADVTLPLEDGVDLITLTHLPLGNYDAAVVTDADGNTYPTSYRRADGKIPVEGEIPVKDGDVLSIAVTHQNGETENWKITVKVEEGAAVEAVRQMIDKLPPKDQLTLSHRGDVEAARKAYENLGEQKSLVGADVVKKLTTLEARLEELAQEEQDKIIKSQSEITKAIQAIPDRIGISDEEMVNTYLARLSSMEDWEGKAALMNRLNRARSEIAARKAKVAEVDDKIWTQINPLDISQSDTTTVKGLMADYSALRADEKAALAHVEDLLDAADVIQSLEEGVIPERVFQNLKTVANQRTTSASKTFTYHGLLSDGRVYTLSYHAADVTATKEINAGVKLLEGSDSLKGTKAQIELAQAGSMNGKAKLTLASKVTSGTYDLYWYNPDKLSIQSAETAKVSDDGSVTMEIKVGGRYWLSDGTVRLDGNQADGSVAGAGASGTVKTTQTGASTAVKNLARTAVKSTTGTTPKTTTTKSSTTGKARTAVRSSSSGKAQKAEEDGLFSEKELKAIKDTNKNLEGSGELSDGTKYTITINGKDVKKTDDFHYEIQSDCGHTAGIGALSEEPLVLCMDKMDAFPGKLMFTIEKDPGKGTPLLFSYDPEKEEAEYVKKVVTEDEQMAFVLSKGGIYFIAERALAASVQNSDMASTAELKTETNTDTSSGDAAEAWDESAELVVTGTKETGIENTTLLLVIAIASCIIALTSLGGSVFLFVKLGGAERFFRKKEGE